MGEINKGAVALILVLLIGAGGYLWYSQLYQPAVAERTAAVQSAQAAQQQLEAAKQQLEAAAKAAEDAKKESAKPDDSVARLAKARTAIPDKKLLDDAAIVLVEMAQRSGVQTSFKAVDEGGDLSASQAGDGTLQGAVPVDLEFEAAGTYAEMMQFMSLVEGNVEAKDDRLYTRGRLFNVVKLEIGAAEEEESGSGFEDSSSDAGEGGFVLGPNDILFTVVVRMYTSSTDNSESVGLTTPDPAAAATADPNAAAGGAGTGATDPNATGDPSVTGDPNVTGTVDPNAAAGATGTDAGATAGAPTTTGGI